MAVIDIRSFSFVGTQAVPAVVRAELSPGVAGFRVEGTPAAAAEALRARVAEALTACSLSLPTTRLTVRVLSPAPGLGRHLELPVAVAVLAVLATMATDALASCAVFGALDADGSVSEAAGLQAAAVQAWLQGLDLICPHCQADAATAGQARLLGAGSLLAVYNHVRGTQIITPHGGAPAGAAPALAGIRPAGRQAGPARAPAADAPAAEDRRRGWLGTLRTWIGAGPYPAMADAQDALPADRGALPSLRGFADRLDHPDIASVPNVSRAQPGVLEQAGSDQGEPEQAGSEQAGTAAPFASTGPQGHRARMREKVIERGAAALADYEILEMLLFLAFKKGDTKPLAKAVINRFGSFAAALSAPEEELLRTPGLGPHAVSAIKIVQAAAERLGRAELVDRPLLNNWDRLMTYLNMVMARHKIEQFRVLFLDTRNRLLADEELGRGTVNHLPVYPREVVRRALEVGATALILVHNHPSGDPTPSTDDIEMTREIIRAADTFGIAVHDHVVVGNGDWRSFRQEGLMPKRRD